MKLGKDFHDLGKTDKTWNRIRFCSACTRSVFISFYFIVGLLFICLFIYLFIYLSIYLFFHSPFMNSGLGSEENTSSHHTTTRIFQECLPGLLGGCSGKINIVTNVWIFLDNLLQGRIHLYIPLCIRGWMESGKIGRICFSNETFCTEQC